MSKTTVAVNFPDQNTGRSTTDATCTFDAGVFGLRIVLRRDAFLHVDAWLGEDDLDALEAALAQRRLALYGEKQKQQQAECDCGKGEYCPQYGSAFGGVRA